MPVVTRAFFRRPAAAGHGDPGSGDHGPGTSDRHGATGIAEAPLLCVVPLCLTAAGTVALFFFAEPIYELLKPMAAMD